jgi:hypothetical protein
LDVIEKHEYLYSDSDSSGSADERESLSSIEEEESVSQDDFVAETRRKLEKLQLRPRATSQPRKSRVKCLPVIESGRTVGYKNTPTKKVKKGFNLFKNG